jgi:hypothetical protein
MRLPELDVPMTNPKKKTKAGARAKAKALHAPKHQKGASVLRKTPARYIGETEKKL